MRAIFLLTLLSFSAMVSSKGLPIAVFHGIGDFCLNPGMSEISEYMGQQVGAYATCIETAGSLLDFITSFESQYEYACKTLQNDNHFAEDFSVVGLSQGALLARAVIQKCPLKGKVRRFISIGGPQAGVGKFPQCTGGFICDIINWGVDKLVYYNLVQNIVGPAGYFKDPRDIVNYLKYSTFLADLNNEKEQKNPLYKQRILDLEKVVLIKFDEDTMILPGETAWFSFYDEKENLINYKDTAFYKEDFIGIRTLDEQGKINFASLPGNHLDFDFSDIDRLMIPALR